MHKHQKEKIKALLKMDHCRYCRATENLTIDHKIPIIQGGTNDIKNLQCLCKRCNGIKSGWSHKELMRFFRWAEQIRQGRLAAGKKPYGWDKDQPLP